MSKTKFIREYLESLKEDNELDYIIPLLLEAMNFRIVTKPTDSKGCDQYGKDVVAIGKEDGQLFLWYFIIKGNADKDITNHSFNVREGIRDSLLAAKDVRYVDRSIPYLNSLKRKIAIVHAGSTNDNAKVQFNSLIEDTFEPGEVEDWNLDKLVNLFAEYLYDESLLCDDVAYKLLKKTLLLCDAPGWKEDDVRALVQRMHQICPIANKRSVISTLAGLKLVLSMILDTCRENKNLLPAKVASDVIVLTTWGWILRNNWEQKAYILKSFDGLVYKHLLIYEEYVGKILPLARDLRGLYMRGSEMEKIFYPMRCYDFLADLMYYYIVVARLHDEKVVREMQEDAMQVIESNSGFEIMTLDTQSIPLLMLAKFLFAEPFTCEQAIYERFVKYLDNLLSNLIHRYRKENMLPELYGNRKACALSLYEKSSEYVDCSSLLLVSLVELIAWLGYDIFYNALRELIKESKVDLQVVFPIPDENLEINLFDHSLRDEVCVETGIQLPKTMAGFKKSFVKRYDPIPFRTEETPYGFLLLLAHKYYQTDLFPDFVNFGFWQYMTKGENRIN